MATVGIRADEIVVTDSILGKGAFGEVRVAQWRGMEVAYKVLHTQNSPVDQQEVEENLKHEIEILSQLRHPNLVLFLGVCSPEEKSMAIVTELLPCSMYDVVEVKKIKLSLPDILDYSLDIAHGLNYLHSHDPSIVHRDISAKNILVTGTRAKIADLGQAKIFSANTLSRQTGMPGAMAYSAPEVLTGKYSAKIDIFSFGILLSQMCTNLYPRVDKREEQIHAAIDSYPILKDIIAKSMSYDPAERPSASDLTVSLQRIHDNDRYYPVSRRSLPEREMSAEVVQYVQSKSSGEISELRLKLEQTQKLLRAEETRWKTEAAAVDTLKDTVAQEQRTRESLQAENARLKEELQQWRERSQRDSATCESLRDQMKLLGVETQRSSHKLQQAESLLRSKEEELRQTHEQGVRTRQELQNVQGILDRTLEQNEAMHRKMDVLTKQLHVQVDYTKDLEARLEQALTRWRGEKETFSAQDKAHKELTRQHALVLERCEAMKKEKKHMEDRLRQYEGLPLPEEIKARLTDLHQDTQELRTQLSLLEQHRDVLLGERHDLEQRVAELSAGCQQLQDTVSLQERKIGTLELQVQEREREKDEACRKVLGLERELREGAGERDGLVQEVQRGKELIDALRLDLDEAQRKLARRRVDGEEGDGKLAEDAVAAEEGGDGGVASPPRPAPVPVVVINIDSSNNDHEESVPTADRVSDIALKHQVERAMGREGAVGLLQLLQTSSHDERAVWRCLRSLRELVLHENASRQATLASRPETWLPAMLKKHIATSMVQAQGARLIGTLSFGDDVFRRKAGEKNIMQTLCDALWIHGGIDAGDGNSGRTAPDATVVLHCLTAITNLCHASYENRCRFAECEGVELLVKVLQCHIQSPKIQTQGCWAVLTLGVDGELGENLFSHNAHVSVIQAMLQHAQEAGVQMYGCWALRNLSLSHSTMAAEIKAKGGMELCRMAIERHKDQGEVLEQARQTMAVLLGGVVTNAGGTASSATLRPGGVSGKVAGSSMNRAKDSMSNNRK